MNWKLLTDGKEMIAVESKDDGSVTQWQYTVWGPVGSSGEPNPETTLREPKNKKERDLIRRAQALYERAMRSGTALAEAMLLAKAS